MTQPAVLTDSDFKNSNNYLETVQNIYRHISLEECKYILKKETTRRLIYEHLTNSNAEGDNDYEYDP